MIIPGDQVDAAVNRVPVGGNLVLRLLPLNRDRHGLAADLQHDHLAWSHARNLTRNVGQPWEARRTGRHHHDMQRADRSPGHPPSRAHRQVPARAARSPGTLVVAGGAVEPRCRLAAGGVAQAARVRGHAGLRARPPIIQPFAGSSTTGSSGRHCAPSSAWSGPISGTPHWPTTCDGLAGRQRPPRSWKPPPRWRPPRENGGCFCPVSSM